MTEDFRIYLDSDVCEKHTESLKTKISKESISRDIDGFLSGDVKTRVAMFHVYFHSSEWVDKLQRIYDCCDLIIVFCTELHSHTVPDLKRIDLPKIVIYIAGFINDYEFNHAQVKQYMDWFWTTSYFYLHSHPTFLSERLDPFAPKPYSFDILLGEYRNHRNAVYNYVNENQLNDKVIMTYFGLSNPVHLKDRGFTLDWDDPNIKIKDPGNVKYSVEYVKYYDKPMSLSQIVPIDIYQKTAYSLVAETNACNEWNFYTEKTTKPILAKRLFIAIAGRYFLKNLRSLGFKTFDCVIDESYDLIEDDSDRWNTALAQMQWLCSQDQTEILSKIVDIVEHNLQILKQAEYFYNTFNDMDRLLTELG
jgi:hypothetical protein